MIPLFFDDALGFNIYRTSILFNRELIRALSKYCITPEQWTIMIVLWSSEKPISQKEIVQSTMKDKFTVSRIIQRMEKKKWVRKVPDEKDGRITLIEATSKGKSLKNIAVRDLNSHFNRILRNLSETEEKTLIQILKKIRKMLGD